MKTLVFVVLGALAATSVHAQQFCTDILYTYTCYPETTPRTARLPPGADLSNPCGVNNPLHNVTARCTDNAVTTTKLPTSVEMATAIKTALKEEREIAYKEQAKLMADLIAQMAASNTNVENTQKLMMRLLDCRGLTANALQKCEAKYPLAAPPAPVSPGPPPKTN